MYVSCQALSARSALGMLRESCGGLLSTPCAVAQGILFLAGTLACQAQTTISTVTMVNNATQTPVEGVGHDYIHALNETVNPQNGQVSIRIAGPSAHERGLNSSRYAYMYDTSGPFAMGGQLSFNSCSTQGSSIPVCIARGDAPVWADPVLPTSGSIAGQMPRSRTPTPP